jgi:glycosyltransferase involved in cell wall biosynthesis
MQTLLLILAVTCAGFWVLALIQWYAGIRSMKALGDLGERRPERYPKVSVVVPALNEARDIRRGLESLLAQDYPELEIVAVDDRSTDGTGRVMDELSAAHPELKVLHVKELPEGWLGKNHALQLGAEASSGEWLLFTDADVEFAPECLRYAVGYAERAQRAHLTVVPEIRVRSILLRGFIAAFHMLFSLFQRPWAASDPGSKAHVGIGAFNLVRRPAYEAVGGHREIPLRPDDDLKLAKLLKRAGFRQECVFGLGLLEVEWYENVRAAVRGLEKSIFPGLDYRVGPVVFSSVFLVLTNVFPFFGVFLASGAARVLFGLSLLVILAVYAYHARYTDTPFYYALLHPVSALFFVYATAYSAYRALRTGGIVWRGTKYPLELLKKNRV